jgi:hypothetical protein
VEKTAAFFGAVRQDPSSNVVTGDITDSDECLKHEVAEAGH